MRKDTPSPARLNELFKYDPDTGHFTRRNTSAPVKESRAGPKGRLQIHVGDGHTMRYAARVAWAMTLGVWPTEQIDHINQDYTDNRLANLREASDRENVQNVSAATSRCLIGLRGVSRQSSGTWRARITIDGVTINIGTFPSPEEASDAYFRAKREMHPFWVPQQQSESEINDHESVISRRAA